MATYWCKPPYYFKRTWSGLTLSTSGSFSASSLITRMLKPYLCVCMVCVCVGGVVLVMLCVAVQDMDSFSASYLITRMLKP